MIEYDFKLFAKLSAEVYIEAETEAEAIKIAEALEYFPENAEVESISSFPGL